MEKIVTITERNLSKVLDMPQETWFRAYKVSAFDGNSPYYPAAKPRFVCETGAVLVHDNPDRDPDKSCGQGVNVGTLKWCLGNLNAGTKPRFIYPPGTKNKYSVAARQEVLPARVWCVEFRGWDIAALPHRVVWWNKNKVKYESKFRLKRCHVVYEVDLKATALFSQKKKTKKKRRS